MFGKLFSRFSRFINAGYGSTWPGHIALSINKNFIKDILKDSKLKVILIAGTNGKTTTGRLLKTILEKRGLKVFQNESGSNILNGIASSLLLHSDILSSIKYDHAIFEMDENTLPFILNSINNPDFIIILNLFRDQLDRYGEINTILNKWRETLKKLNGKTTLILNSDDPQIAYLGEKIRNKVLYFGLNDKKFEEKKYQHAADSTYCPKCNSKLYYNTVYYSHLGDWQCKKCKYKIPDDIFSNIVKTPLSGIYNNYNILAATTVALTIGVPYEKIEKYLVGFTPAFGRQEKLEFEGKKIQIFLSKNPTSFNQSLRTVRELKGKNILIVLNDRIPDGTDVSWIWDVDFEDYIDGFENIVVSGDRAYDMGLRMKYAVQSFPPMRDPALVVTKFKVQSYNSKFKIYEDLKIAINESLKTMNEEETLYILPTYSAMLETRKILTGKKIL